MARTIEADELAEKARNITPISRRDAKQIVLLLSQPALWIDRKVESLQFNGDGSTRRSISFDFWLPAPFARRGFVPLTPLAKQDLRSLDLSGANGESLSTLIKQDNADMAVQLLASGIASAKVTQVVEDLLTQMVIYPSIGIAKDDQEFKETMLGAYEALLERNFLKEHYLKLAETLIDGFLLWVEVPEAGTLLNRYLVKVSYQESISFRWSFQDVFTKINQLLHLKISSDLIKQVRKLEIPRAVSDAIIGSRFRSSVFPHWSARYHFELRAPLGLLVKSMYLGTEAIGDSRARNFEDDEECPVQISHASLFGQNLPKNLFAFFELLPDRQGFPRVVLLSSSAVTLIMGLPFLSHVFQFGWFRSTDIGTTIPLLLLGPALLIGFLARPPEHDVISSRLRLFRFSLCISSGTLIFASAILSGVFASSRLWMLWEFDCIVSVLGTLCAIYLYEKGAVRCY